MSARAAAPGQVRGRGPLLVAEPSAGLEATSLSANVRILTPVAGTLSRPEFDGLRRSAAMAPLAHQNVARLLEAYNELLAERDGRVASFRRLMPAWGEVGEVLNELSKQVGH